MNAKLTVVTAPAGYGKTMAISEWVRQASCTAGWISLDRYDNDLMRFWSYVIAAFRKDDPGFGEKATSFLPTLEEHKYDSFIAALISDFSSASGEYALLLDDYHVIELASIHDSIAYMLEFLPPRVHLYIASRAALPIPTSRLQAKGEMRAITVQDLRFGMDEGIRFFRECMGIEVSDEDAGLLVHQTEGWVSGLHLAALSLRRCGDPAAFIREFSGRHQDIAQYLLEEIHDKQSDEMKSFLLQTSILDRMSASLCEAVTGMANAAAQFRELERQNLFMIRLDDHGEWYRYHHLFEDFLQRQLRRAQPDGISELHGKAAAWLKENGLPVEAIEHWMVGGHYAEAASAIETHLEVLQNYRSSLIRWLEQLPERLLGRKPFLQLLHLKIMIEDGDVHRAEWKLRSLEHRLSSPEWEPWVGTYYFASAENALYGRDLPRVYKYLELYERYEPRGHRNPIQMIGGNTLSGVGYVSLLSYFSHFHDAEKLLLTCIRIWEEKGLYPFLGYFYYFYSQLLYEWNRLDEAEAYMTRVFSRSHWQPYARIQFLACNLLVHVQLAKGKPEAALAILEQARDRLNTPEKELFMRKLDVIRSYVCVRAGRSEEVADWIRSCGMKPTDAVPSLYRDYYLYARALIEVGRASEAMPLLDRLLRLTQDKDWMWDQVKVLITYSIALERQGQEEEALIKLELALHLAEPQGMIRSFIDEGEAVGSLLVRYLKGRQHGAIRLSLPVSLLYVKQLLHKMSGQLHHSLDVPALLTEQEIRILQAIAADLKNREIAERYGISSETVKKHIKNIYQKLEVSSRLQALKSAKELNLL